MTPREVRSFNDPFGIDPTSFTGLLTEDIVNLQSLARAIDRLETLLDAIYAPIAKGVTNGDSHDHNGGDGAAIPIAGTVNGVDKTTFTPTIEGTTTAGAGTYTTQAGYYVRIFNVVYFSATLVWTAHTGTGNMRINGLPITSANIGLNSPAAVIWSNITLTAVGNKLFAAVLANSTQVGLYEIGSGVLANLPIDTSGTIQVSGFYFV